MESRSWSEYFNHGKGFEAKIKQVPEHFIVDELSSFTGEPAEPDLSTANNGASNVLKRPAAVAGDDCTYGKPKRMRLSSDDSVHEVVENPWDDVDCCKQRLEKLLGSETHSNLLNFAQKVEAVMGKTEEKTIPVQIGEFSDRDERTFVHRSIRLIYPFLKTVTKPNTVEVSVQICPNYWKFVEVLGHQMSSKIFKFIHIEVLENLKKQMAVEGQYTKDERRKIHHLISCCFGKFMETRTLSSAGDEQRIITIRRKPHLNKTAGSTDEDPPIITAFTLWKKNCETYAAIHNLGRHLNMLHNKFHFAGIKDKRAVTTQKCTVTGISPDKFEAACKFLPSFLKVSDFQRVSRGIRLGELDGNRFCIKLIRIRNVQPISEKSSLEEDIRTAVEDVETTGFINYFGPQRFGRPIFQDSNGDRLPIALEAPAAGLAMLQKDFRKAVDILLTPTEQMSSESDKAKKHFQETRNIEETVKMMPKEKLRELSILRTLKRVGAMDNDACAKALLSLPHSARLLYVHSFCSYLWNDLATKRIQKYGNQVVEGDLVKESDCSDRNKSAQVLTVSAEALAQNKYTLKDVVLPIPGSRVRYPSCLEQEYRDWFERLSIRPNQMFRIPDLKIYAPGAYRKLVQAPTNLSLKILPHKDSSKVKKHGEQKSTNTHEDCVTSDTQKDDLLVNPELDAAYQPLRDYENFDIELTFDLPPSCYATTFLSELTKGHLK